MNVCILISVNSGFEQDGQSPVVSDKDILIFREKSPYALCLAENLLAKRRLILWREAEVSFGTVLVKFDIAPPRRWMRYAA